MKGMILAAGFGTRLRPVTYEMPKPMAPLCNRPLIGYAIEAMLQAGVREIVINLHHLPAAIEEWARAEYAGRIDFSFSFEPEILGTGGGIRNVRQQLENAEDFALMNGDTIVIPPLDALAERRRSHNSVATLLLRHPPAGDRFTKVFHDDGFVTGFGEGRGEPLMFAGCHVISREIFGLLPDRPFSGITEDVYIPATRKSGKELSAIVDDGVWFDIGTPERFLSASRALLNLMVSRQVAPTAGSHVAGDSLSADDATIEGSFRSSTFGARSLLAADASAVDSSIWDGARIESGADVRSSIIGREVLLDRGARISNALVCRRIEGIEYPTEIRAAGDLVYIAVDPKQPVLVQL